MKSEDLDLLVKERALAFRKRLGSKRPRFQRQESWRYKRVKDRWRKPKGIDSKMRKKVKGWPKSVSVGYRGPKKTRGLHPSGYVDVLVRTVGDVNNVDARIHAIRISHRVGAKKRVSILEKAREKEIYVLNPKEEEMEPEENKEVIAEKEQKNLKITDGVTKS